MVKVYDGDIEAHVARCIVNVGPVAVWKTSQQHLRGSVHDGSQGHPD